jgi:hypothetical protein
MVYDYVIVDTKLLAYNSSYYRHEPVTNFLAIVTRALVFNKIKYKKLVFAHDINKSKYRLDKWKGYKGGRKVVQDREDHTDQSRREEFIAKYKRLPSILKYIGLQINHIPTITNYEADDVPYMIKQLDPEATQLLVSLDGDWVLNLDERTHILKYDTNTLITDESYIIDRYGMTKDELKEAWEVLGQTKDSIYNISKIGLKRWSQHFVPLPTTRARLELLQLWLDTKKYGCKVDTKAKFDTWQDNYALNQELMSFMTLEDHEPFDVEYAQKVLNGDDVEEQITYKEWIELSLMELGEVPPITEGMFLALQKSIHIEEKE